VIIDDHGRGEEEHGTVAETLFAAATDVAGTGVLQAIPGGNMAMERTTLVGTLNDAGRPLRQL
jgi:hypothetical protein